MVITAAIKRFNEEVAFLEELFHEPTSRISVMKVCDYMW